MASWATVSTTWATDTTQWAAPPYDFPYVGSIGAIAGITSTACQGAAVSGSVFVLVNPIPTMSYIVLYYGGIVANVSVDVADVDILTWTPSTSNANAWVEELSL